MIVSDWMESLMSMFYIVAPSDYVAGKKSFEFREAWPFFALFILLENAILFGRKKRTYRFNDSVISITHGVFYECGRIMTRGLENYLYVYVYENYKLLELPCDSPWQWYIMAVTVDFFYYWVHRASHEIHILWAQHQVHHSSEDYNLTVGLRHPFLHNVCGFIFYMPMALFISPKQFVIHQQFNLLYQFWVHSAIVNNVGPLEYILNTPSHHRIHHGSNNIYLDKNYGGVLIIWDKFFGTFKKFNPSQNITYGIVKQPQIFNPLYQQIFYNKVVMDKVRDMNGYSYKIQSLIKGPSWFPGSRWTGDEGQKINIQERKIYDPELSSTTKYYLLLHFSLCLIFFHKVTISNHLPLLIFFYLLYVITSLTIIGMFFDRNPVANFLEIIRCCITYLFIRYAVVKIDGYLPWLQFIYGASAIFCITKYFEVPEEDQKWQPKYLVQKRPD